MQLSSSCEAAATKWLKQTDEQTKAARAFQREHSMAVRDVETTVHTFRKEFKVSASVLCVVRSFLIDVVAVDSSWTFALATARGSGSRPDPAHGRPIRAAAQVRGHKQRQTPVRRAVHVLRIQH